MSLSAKETIIPRRSHGANPRRVSGVVGGASGPMRTRGDILLRDQAGSLSTASAQPSMLLSDLVDKVREELGQLPLTITIHNWGSKSAQEFLDVLDPWLKKGDAIWLIPIAEVKITTALPELEGVVVLNLNRPIDQRVYSNLMGDIVFFPADDEAEAAHDTQFMRPARAVLVDGREEQAGADRVAAHALSLNLVTYLWNGAESVAEFTGSDSNNQPVAEGPTAKLTPDEIGQFLKTTASHVEGLIYHRQLFQARLEQVPNDPEIPNWDEMLVRQANQKDWPQWAVECLPCYVPLKSFPDGSQRALVWKYVIDCLPDSDSYQSVLTLCDDRIHEVHMSAEAVRLVEGFARIFENCLRPLPYPTDGAFEGTIDYALLQIEARFPEASQKTKLVREEFRQFRRMILANT